MGKGKPDADWIYDRSLTDSSSASYVLLATPPLPTEESSFARLRRAFTGAAPAPETHRIVALNDASVQIMTEAQFRQQLELNRQPIATSNQ
jgi:hypothetical protein